MNAILFLFFFSCSCSSHFCQSQNVLADALRLRQMNKNCVTGNGNTYDFDIQVMPSMDSRRAVYHRLHKFDVPMMLNRMIRDRVEFVHYYHRHHVFYHHFHHHLVDSVANLMDLAALAAENYWIAHSTHEDIDRYHFHIEDFVNSSLYDVLIDLEIVLKHLDNRKLIDNHRLYFRGCNTNLQKKKQLMNQWVTYVFYHSSKSISS